MSGRGKTKKAGKTPRSIPPPRISFKGKAPLIKINPANAPRIISAADKKRSVDPTKRASRIARPRIITLPNISVLDSSGGGSEMAEIELTPLAYSIFGESYVKELIKTGIIETVRDIWELSTPTTQCGNIIGAPTSETTCWICSLPLATDEGLTPECEHVLPIAQAVMYLGLFSISADKKIFPSDMTVLSGEAREKLQLEYRWAHRICNQVKNDDSYLDFDLTKQEYFVRSDKIADLVNRIKTNSRSYGAAIKPLLRDKATVDRAIANAIATYGKICEHLNTYKAPRLLELAGIISAGYGPRKVSVNPKWEHGARVISAEELEGNMRKEIIKANIEYEGIYKKTLTLVSNLTDIGEAAAKAFRKIIEIRRPEYVSLLMRITPSPKNMKHAIAYIRSQLFSELASVDAKLLGLTDSARRTTANERFRSLLERIGAFTPVDPDPKFNAELTKANRLYQEDSSIGDTIRTMLSKYIKETEVSADDIQAELVIELKESGGEADPVDPSSEYAEIISHTTELMGSMNPASMFASAAETASVAPDPWVDMETNAILHQQEVKWDELSEEDERAIVKDVAGALLTLMGHTNAMAVNLKGGYIKTRKLRRRRV